MLPRLRQAGALVTAAAAAARAGPSVRFAAFSAAFRCSGLRVDLLNAAATRAGCRSVAGDGRGRRSSGPRVRRRRRRDSGAVRAAVGKEQPRLHSFLCRAGDRAAAAARRRARQAELPVGTRPFARTARPAARCSAAQGSSSALTLSAPLQPYQAPNWGCAGGGMSPFTFTKDLVKRKNYFKRTAYIMQARPAACAACTAWH